VEVSIRWRNSKAAVATLRSRHGGILTVQPPPGQKIAGLTVASRRAEFRPSDRVPNSVMLDCPAGKVVRLHFEN
jgi:hypothetical protein